MPFIKVTFYGRFWGTVGDGTRTQIEWPPSPSRLYSTLVSAMYESSRCGASIEGVRSALLWLEKIPPPEIYYEKVIVNKSPTVMVPVPHKTQDNAIGFHPFPAKRGRTFPCVHVQYPVYYGWNSVDPSHWDSIAKLLPHVFYLGTQRSMCQMETTSEAPKDMLNIKPSPYGKLMLQCYYEGRLSHLDDSYDAGHTHQPIVVGYDNVQRVRRNAPCLYGKVSIYKLIGPFKPELTDSPIVASAIRSRMGQICKDLNVIPPAIIAKDKNAHVSILPLPYVGFGYATGKIHGVAIAVPQPDSTQEKVLNSLSDFHYFGQKWELIKVVDKFGTLSPNRWFSPSNHWTSVTPLEVRHGNETTRKEYIVHHCENQLGLPKIKMINIYNVSPISHVPPARAFKSRNKLNGQQSGWLDHCEIVFSETIRGPLALCRGRNFGIGLMLPSRMS